jgi:cobalt-zinc-cadmium resistance protein CzcA
MFHPMAYGVLALLGAMLLSVTFVPAAVACSSATACPRSTRSWLGRTALQAAAVGQPANAPVVATLAAMLVLFCGVVATAGEFVPNLNEGTSPGPAHSGTSLTQSVEMQKQLEVHPDGQVPEIERIFARTGTAEIASDPMPPNISDGYIMLKPLDKWPSRARRVTSCWPPSGRKRTRSRQQLRVLTANPAALQRTHFGRAFDVAVKVFGDDNEVLNKTATRSLQVLQGIPGATEVKVEQTTGLPMLTVAIDRSRRHATA